MKLKASLSLLLLAVFWVAIKPAPAFAQASQAAKKFDEFGDVQYSDLIARLDNFAIHLQDEPGTKGFIVVYRTHRDLPGLSNRIALQSKDYLVNSRGLSKDRVVTVDGGEADCQIQELWIASPGSTPRPRSDAYQRYFPDTDSPRKIDEYGFEPPDRSARATSGDEIDAEYLETVAIQLQKQPRSSAYIIAYAQYNPRPGLVDYGKYEPVRDVRLDPPGTVNERLRLERKRLIRVYGIPALRIKTINGGYRKRRMVELWIVPRGEHAPIPTPNSFPPKSARWLPR
jgi:hypothetical protein